MLSANTDSYISPAIDASSATIVEKLRLLSPRTWYGLYQVVARSPFSNMDSRALQQSLAGAVLPIVILFLLSRPLKNNEKPFLIMRTSALVMPSPWIIQCVFRFVVELSRFLSKSISFLRLRKNPYTSARETLKDRIHSHRAYRTNEYDVYLPSERKFHQKAILMLPGALVPHSAYAEFASRLSDAGFVVVVVSLEPCLLADPCLGASLQRILRIMKSTEEQADSNSQLNWSLMGHSMGAFGIMRLYDQYCKAGGNAERSRIRNVILLGVAAFIEESTNLTSYNDFEQTRILLIQGSKDGLVDLFKHREDELYSDYLPKTLVRKEIAGGTHEGFASYHEQDENEVGAIPRHEQQSQVCDMIRDFLLVNAE